MNNEQTKNIYAEIDERLQAARGDRTKLDELHRWLVGKAREAEDATKDAEPIGDVFERISEQDSNCSFRAHITRDSIEFSLESNYFDDYAGYLTYLPQPDGGYIVVGKADESIK